MPVVLPVEDVYKRQGLKTISLYAIEPEHSTCKWIAMDADHDKAFSDLAAVQYDLKQEGIEALLEKSRRGGHLWIFAAEPLPAALCRILVYTLALSIGAVSYTHLDVYKRQRLDKVLA